VTVKLPSVEEETLPAPLEPPANVITLVPPVVAKFEVSPA
jgi:hypothetical protein